MKEPVRESEIVFSMLSVTGQQEQLCRKLKVLFMESDKVRWIMSQI